MAARWRQDGAQRQTPAHKHAERHRIINNINSRAYIIASLAPDVKSLLHPDLHPTHPRLPWLHQAPIQSATHVAPAPESLILLCARTMIKYNSLNRKLMKRFIQLPRNKVRRIDQHGCFDGLIQVPLSVLYGGPTRLEQFIAYEVLGPYVLLGSRVMGYRDRGDGVFEFSANINLDRIQSPESADAEEFLAAGYHVLADRSPLLRQLLQKQYGLLDSEVSHLIGALDADYECETVVNIAGGLRSIHCPSYPQECDYLRVVIDGYELAYWTSDEWGCSPAEVIGAVMGAAKGTSNID